MTENTQIDPFDLPSISLVDDGINSIPRCCGVYFVISKAGEVVYVGMAQNFRSRWRAHPLRRDVIANGARIAFLAVDERCDVVEIEKQIIREMKPRFNTVHARGIEGAKRLTIDVELEVHQAIRSHCFHSGVSISDFVRDAIGEKLKKSGVEI